MKRGIRSASMRKRQTVWSAAFFAVVLATAAQASVNYFAFGTENYLAGFCATDDCGTPGEHRNFFTFTIPDLDGPVSSAVLTINTGGTSFGQSPTATYQVTSLPDTFGFDDLGTGTVFGSLDYSADSTDTDQSILLNTPALAAISPDS